MTQPALTSSNARLSDSFFLTSGNCYETHISAVCSPSKTHTWFSRTHAYKGRPSSDPSETGKRSSTSWGLRHSDQYRRAQRLRGEAVFGALARGKRRRAGSISVFVQTNGLAFPRLGLIVPKRFLPRAVDRNRAKRVLREWFRRNQVALKGRDLLVRVDARPARLQSVVADLEQVLGLER